MKNNKITLKISILMSLMLMLVAFYQKTAKAEGHNENVLAKYIQDELITLDNSVQVATADAAVVDSSDDSEGYFFRRFWLRLRPRVERDVPFLAGFSVIGELELLWEKPVPEGWETYKPK